VSPFTSVINAISHGWLSPWQREALSGLLLHLSARSGIEWCPEMSQVQAAYTELLITGDTAAVAAERDRAPLTSMRSLSDSLSCGPGTPDTGHDQCTYSTPPTTTAWSPTLTWIASIRCRDR
jgi:hypothetical protein